MMVYEVILCVIVAILILVVWIATDVLKTLWFVLKVVLNAVVDFLYAVLRHIWPRAFSDE